MKVFISYSSHDRATAERLFADLIAAGADAFQYSRSAKAGRASWEQVVNWISESDVFMVLVSKSSLHSPPVCDEIEHAHYWYVNKRKPGRLIPLMIEKGVEPHLMIAPYSRIDFTSYDAGTGRLMSQLGLKKGQTSAPKLEPLPDLSSLWRKYKEKHPEPDPISKWSKGAQKIVANYEALAPPGIKGNDRKDHIDTLLAEYSGKPAVGPSPKLANYNQLFTEANPFLMSAPNLSEFLLTYDPPLEAPKLTRGLGMLLWTKVAGASSYVLEASVDATFTHAVEAYRGEATSFPIFGVYFRVKALGPSGGESGWSNVLLAPAPLLKLDHLPYIGAVLNWTAVSGAKEYVLERISLIVEPEVIYRGPNLTFTDKLYTARSIVSYSYRVKATLSHLLGDSPWSNIVPDASIDASLFPSPYKPT